MHTNLAVAATPRIDKSREHPFSVPRSLAFCFVGDFPDEIFQQNVIPLLPKHHTIRRLTVAPCAPSFLVVLLNRLWQREMNHRAHGRLVDAQSKRDCADQHSHLVRHPALLILPAHRRFHLRVIRNRPETFFLQALNCFLDASNGWRIHDHATLGVMPQRAQQQLHLCVRIALARDVAQILAVETGDVQIGFAQLQLFQNVVTNLLGGTGRKTRNRQIRKSRAQTAQLAVVRAELMSPFRDTVRFVDREKSHWHLAQPIKRIPPRQPLRRKIKQPIVAPLRIDHHFAMFGRRLKTIDRCRRNSHLRQLRRLILHERDQRRNHDRRLTRNHRWQLIAQRLATTRRHDHASVPPRQQTANDTFLLGAKFVIAPVAAKCLHQIWRGFRHEVRLSHYRRASLRSVCDRVVLNL